MTLNEAIEHLESELSDKDHNWGCEECRQEHAQLLEWLKDYKLRLEHVPKIYTESVKHGKWINTEPEYNYESHNSAHYQCSVCGRRTGIRQTKTYKYCPKCGTKMDGGDKNE